MEASGLVVADITLNTLLEYRVYPERMESIMGPRKTESGHCSIGMVVAWKADFW